MYWHEYPSLDLLRHYGDEESTGVCLSVYLFTVCSVIQCVVCVYMSLASTSMFVCVCCILLSTQALKEDLFICYRSRWSVPLSNIYYIESFPKTVSLKHSVCAHYSVTVSALPLTCYRFIYRFRHKSRLIDEPAYYLMQVVCLLV